MPEKLRKNRLACRMMQIETDTDLNLKKIDAAQKAREKHSATN